MMKKILWILAFGLLFALTACGGVNSDEGKDSGGSDGGDTKTVAACEGLQSYEGDSEPVSYSVKPGKSETYETETTRFEVTCSEDGVSATKYLGPVEGADDTVVDTASAAADADVSVDVECTRENRYCDGNSTFDGVEQRKWGLSDAQLQVAVKADYDGAYNARLLNEYELDLFEQIQVLMPPTVTGLADLYAVVGGQGQPATIRAYQESLYSGGGGNYCMGDVIADQVIYPQPEAAFNADYSTLSMNAFVEVDGAMPEWLHIVYGDTEGWVEREAVMFDTEGDECSEFAPPAEGISQAEQMATPAPTQEVSGEALGIDVVAGETAPPIDGGIPAEDSGTGCSDKLYTYPENTERRMYNFEIQSEVIQLNDFYIYGAPTVVVLEGAIEPEERSAYAIGLGSAFGLYLDREGCEEYDPLQDSFRYSYARLDQGHSGVVVDNTSVEGPRFYRVSRTQDLQMQVVEINDLATDTQAAAMWNMYVSARDGQGGQAASALPGNVGSCLGATQNGVADDKDTIGSAEFPVNIQAWTDPWNVVTPEEYNLVLVAPVGNNGVKGAYWEYPNCSLANVLAELLGKGEPVFVLVNGQPVQYTGGDAPVADPFSDQ